MEHTDIEKAAEQFARILVAQIEGEAKARRQSETTGSMAGTDKAASKGGKSEPTHTT